MTSSGPTAAKKKVNWEYDCKGRRIRQTTYDGSSGSYLVTEDFKFISDGWRHLAELNATNNTLIRSYAWGLDLSGTLDGAGGVGGLLMLNSMANGVHFYAYDGNGNVAALVKASDGTVSANYEYDSFGQTLRATGTAADENRFRFSTKRTDNTTDFVLYEYRIYVPWTGRWLSRDPIGEAGGINAYCYVENRPTSRFDLDGRRMSLTVVATELLQPPTEGPYIDYDGLTWFEKFEPRASVYKSLVEPCCWKIFIPGEAVLYYWWVKNAPGPDGSGSALGHELLHVAVHRDTFNGFNADASAYTETCFSKPKADCFRAVINGQMRTAWLAHNHTENLRIDRYYRQDEIEPAEIAETTATEQLTASLEECARME